MPRSQPADVLLSRPSALARSAAFAAALLATAGALALAALTLWRGGALSPPASIAWLIVAALACTAAGVAWALWRQRELGNALREARLEARELLALSPVWHWRCDSAHRLTWLLPAPDSTAADWAGPGIGQTLWEHYGGDAAAAAALRARVQGGARLDGLRVWRRGAAGTGEAFELRGAPVTDAQGNAAGYRGCARSLGSSASRDAEQQTLLALLQALPMPAFVVSASAGAPSLVEAANGAAALWLGLQPAQLYGMAWADLLARSPQDLRAPLAHALADGVDEAAQPLCAGWDVRARRIEGALPRWALTLQPQARADDTPAAAVSDSESFSYTVSHDLRAPIRVVEGFTKILKEDYGRQLDRVGNDHLDRVLGAAARMNSMIDALLALSQLSSRPLSRQPVNLSQLAGYVVEDLRRQAPEREVSVHIQAGLQTQGDPTLLRMVLENLLGNAWKYSAKKGEAQIWLERGLHDGQPVFTVRDNGAGFDMRFADRLFGVFQRLHSANDFAGTGVGLASVRRIVRRHGGEVWAESAVERGSSFHFTLPAGIPGG